MGIGFFAGLKLGVTCTNLQNSADVLINRHCERGILNKNMLSKANDIMRMNFLEIQDMCVEEATAIKLAAFYSIALNDNDANMRHALAEAIFKFTNAEGKNIRPNTASIVREIAGSTLGEDILVLMSK